MLQAYDNSEKNINDCRQSLEYWWGIKNRENLLSTLAWLLQEGDRYEFDRLLGYVVTMSDREYKKILKNTTDLQKKNQLQTVYENQGLGKKSILAWDACRFVYLCRVGYFLDYLNEEEAWELILPTALTLQQTFNSWKDLGNNYLIGRQFWSYQQTEMYGDEFQKAYKELLSNPQSPWNTIPWDLTPQ